MGYLDQMRQVTKSNQEASTVNPSSSSGRQGYFDWSKHHSKDNPNEAIGILLPPYATYMDERMAAAIAGKPFPVPFWVDRGLHAIGGHKDKNKFYCNCRKTLVEADAASSGLVPKSILDAGKECPVCDVCWGEVWPEVQKHKPADINAATPEYKHWKELHKWLCPQQKMVFNWLPLGSNDPVIFDAAQTIGEAMKQIHYDPKQPDLLWPVTNPGVWTSSWVQITRQKSEQATKYLVNTVYVGMPHVVDAQQNFVEEVYRNILAKLPDLRKLCETFVPDAATIQKAVQKVNDAKRQFGMAVATDHAVAATIARATEGVTGGAATAPPPPITVIPVVASPSPVMAPIPVVNSPIPPVQASAASFQATPPVQNPASVTPDSRAAHDMLTELINRNPTGTPPAVG